MAGGRKKKKKKGKGKQSVKRSWRGRGQMTRGFIGLMRDSVVFP